MTLTSKVPACNDISQQVKIAELWIRIRIGSAVLDPNPYWECGSGSRSMEIDQNLQVNLVSWFCKYVYYSLTRIGLVPWIQNRIRIRTEINSWNQIRNRMETNADPQH